MRLVKDRVSMSAQRVVFKNMQPSAEEKNFAHTVVQSILEAAPHDSRALALMEKVEEGYRCSIDIYSPFGGPFIAQVTESDPSRALEKLANELGISRKPA
jgi:hypothetical protein